MNRYSRGWSVIFFLGCVPSVHAAWQTTDYIALFDAPKYAASQRLAYSNPNAPKGGVLILGEDGRFDNLNSMNGKGNSSAGNAYLFDSLMTKSLDEVGVYYPLLAEKVSYDPQQVGQVIFHLNPKARFSDGSRLTAQDVKTSFDLYQTQSNFGLQMYLSGLAKTEVIDSHRVKMTFKQRHQPDMLSIVVQMPIYSQREWRSRDFKQMTLKPILGSGPYTVARVYAGKALHYQRNPHYWGKDLWVNQGRYNFNQIQYRYFRSPEMKFEAFKAGRITLFEEKKAHLWQKHYQFPAVQRGDIRQKKFRHHNAIPTQSFVFNTRRNPLSDLYFRQALTYAYDFEWMNRAMLGGQYQRLNSFFANSELASSAQPTAAEQAILKPYLSALHPVQRELVQRPWQYPVSKGDGYNRDNLLTARKILLRNGYRYRDGRLHDRQGRVVQLEFLVSQSDQQYQVLAYMRHLKRLGIAASIRMVDSSQYYERLRHYEFDIVLNQMPQSLTPGQEQMQLWGSQAAKNMGNYNYAGIQNTAIDGVIVDLLKASRRQQVLAYTHALDRLLRAGFYHLPTYGTGDYRYAYWNMYRQPAHTARYSAALDYWWVDTAQAKKLHKTLNLQ